MNTATSDYTDRTATPSQHHPGWRGWRGLTIAVVLGGGLLMGGGIAYAAGSISSPTSATGTGNQIPSPGTLRSSGGYGSGMMGGSTGGSGGYGSGMMGGSTGGPGGYGAGMTGGSPSVTSASALSRLVTSLVPGTSVDPAANRITYHTSQVDLVMVGAPPGRSGMYWQADGRVNPTIVIPAGSSVTVNFADGDPGTIHGWELTTAGPPFPVMAMMAGQIAAPGAFAMPVNPPSASNWYGRTLHFTAPPPGTYHYICPVPGHAASGMWGTLVVA
jgi:rusticyanin